MVLTVFAAVAVIVCGIFTRYYLGACTKKEYNRAFWLKGGASICFVVTGLVFAGKCSDAGFALLVVLGLVGGILGDQLLALRFIYTKKHDLFFLLGMLAFAAGHVLYTAALLRYDPTVVKIALIYTVFGLAASAAWMLGNKASVPRALLIAGAFYFALLIFMGGCALGCALHNPCLGTWLLFAGGLCFAISDNILSVHSFGKEKKPAMNTALHIFYYGAQMLIALSLWVL